MLVDAPGAVARGSGMDMTIIIAIAASGGCCLCALCLLLVVLFTRRQKREKSDDESDFSSVSMTDYDEPSMMMHSGEYGSSERALSRSQEYGAAPSFDRSAVAANDNSVIYSQFDNIMPPSAAGSIVYASPDLAGSDVVYDKGFVN